MFSYRGVIGVIDVEAIKWWAKFHLSYNGDEITYDIVVVLYHGDAHWSLFVLELVHTFHVDSKLGIHDYLVRDILIQQICKALLLFKGVHHVLAFDELVGSSILNVPTFT